MRRPLAVATLAAATGLLPACVVPPAEDPYSEDQDYVLGESEVGIVPLPIDEPWPDLSIGWQRREELAQATGYSLAYLGKPSSKTFFPYGPYDEITHERMVASLERFHEVLTESRSAEEFLNTLTAEFEIWVARGRSNTGDVYFTGYGTPILDGSMRRGGAYQYPLYKKPDDLIKDPDGTIRGRALGDGSFAP